MWVAIAIGAVIVLAIYWHYLEVILDNITKIKQFFIELSQDVKDIKKDLHKKGEKNE